MCLPIHWNGQDLAGYAEIDKIKVWKWKKENIYMNICILPGFVFVLCHTGFRLTQSQRKQQPFMY